MSEIIEKFLDVDTQEALEAQISAGDVTDEHIAFIDSPRKIWARGRYYNGSDTVPFANDLTGRIEATPEEFTFRPSAGDKSIRDESALIKKIKGNTLVWNQLFSDPKCEGRFAITGTDEGMVNGYRRIVGTKIQKTVGYPTIKLGHRYLEVFSIRTDATVATLMNNGALKQTNITLQPQKEVYAILLNGLATRVAVPAILITDGTYIELRNWLYFDLTQMFGAGNEPATVEEFKALFPNDYYDYNAGELVSMTFNGLFANGFNQFNGEYAEVLPNNTYYLGGTYTTIGFAEEIGGTLENITIPTDKLYTPTKKGYIYAAGTNICINLSHTGVRDGEYEPYWDATKDLSIIQKYFPNGMRSAGSIYDEISFDETTQKWVAIQRVGERAFVEGDNENAQVITNGTNTHYELAEPIITTIEEPIDLSYKVGDFGIEKMLSDSFSAPFKADIIYQFNATDRVRENSMNISKLSKKQILLENEVDALESKVDTEIEGINTELDAITTELEEVGENFFPLKGILPANQIGEFKANATNNGKEREWSLATAKIDYLRGNRLAFLQSSEFTIEHSYDNGATWEARVNTTQAALTLWADQPWGVPFAFGSSFTTGAMLRITIAPNSARQGLIEMLAIKLFENGGKFNIKVESNTSSAQDVWTERCNVSPSTTTWCPTYLISYGKWLYGENDYHLRLTFTALKDGSKNSSLIAIGAYGLSTGVTTQVTPQLAMAGLGHMYNWDYLQNVQFPNKVTASAFVKSGGTSSQILMADGSTKTDAGLSINYSQVGLSTSGKKVIAGVPVVLSPYIDVIRPNHLAFLQDDEYVVERSDDSGETWNEVAKTDDIRKLFIGNNSGALIIASAPEKMLRITIKPIGRYTQYEWLYLYTASPYNATNPPTTVTVEYSYGGAPDTWIGAITSPINGQPAPNVVGLGVENLGGTGSVGYGLRLTFQTTVTSTTSLRIYGIELHGTRIYTAKNNMMRWSHLYSTDASQNASFPAKVTATEFNTTNGKALTTDAQTLTEEQQLQVASNIATEDVPKTIVRRRDNGAIVASMILDDSGQTYAMPFATEEAKTEADYTLLTTETTPDINDIMVWKKSGVVKGSGVHIAETLEEVQSASPNVVPTAENVMQVISDAIPTQIAEVMEVVPTSNVTTIVMYPNRLYEASYGTTMTALRLILDATGASMSGDNTWKVRFTAGGSNMQFTILDNATSSEANIYWLNGTPPTFDVWGFHEITFKRAGQQMWLGEWKCFQSVE